MSIKNTDEILTIMEFIKTTNLKGYVEITGEDQFIWDLGGVFLSFFVGNRETTVLYSSGKSLLGEIGHFHEDNCDVISLIQDINNEEKRVHIAVVLGSSMFSIEHQAEKKKKNWVLARHYYSEL